MCLAESEASSIRRRKKRRVSGSGQVGQRSPVAIRSVVHAPGEVSGRVCRSTVMHMVIVSQA